MTTQDKLSELFELVGDLKTGDTVTPDMLYKLVEIVKAQQDEIAALKAKSQSIVQSEEQPSNPVATIEKGKYYSKAEVARFLGKSVQTLYNNKNRNSPTFTKIGTGQPKILGTDLLDYIDKNGIRALSSNDYHVYQHERKFFNEESWKSYLLIYPDSQPQEVQAIPVVDSDTTLFAQLLSPTLPDITPEIADSFDTGAFILEALFMPEIPTATAFVSAIRHLHKNGVEINQNTSLYYRNGLHVIAMYGDNLEVQQSVTTLIDCLIDCGIDIHSQDYEGHEPHELASQGSIYLQWYESQTLANELENFLPKK